MSVPSGTRLLQLVSGVNSRNCCTRRVRVCAISSIGAGASSAGVNKRKGKTMRINSKARAAGVVPVAVVRALAAGLCPVRAGEAKPVAPADALPSAVGEAAPAAEGEAVMGEPAAPPNPEPGLPIVKNPKLPVLGVDNPHRDEFFRRLSEKIGRKCRLPTAAEWEYAARCGTSNPPWSGRYAVQNSRDPNGKGYWHMTLPVKSKKPNAWGLYDLMSSLWEIVGDTALSGTLDIVETTDPFHAIPPGTPPAKAAHNAYGKEFDITETSAGEVPGNERAGHYMERFRIVVEQSIGRRSCLARQAPCGSPGQAKVARNRRCH